MNERDSSHCTHCTALYCPSLHCTALHCTTLHCTALEYTALHCSSLHCSVVHPHPLAPSPVQRPCSQPPTTVFSSRHSFLPNLLNCEWLCGEMGGYWHFIFRLYNLPTGYCLPLGQLRCGRSTGLLAYNHPRGNNLTEMIFSLN